MVTIRIKRSHEPFDGRGSTWVDFVILVTPQLASSSLGTISSPLFGYDKLELSEAMIKSMYSPKCWLEGGSAYESLMAFAIRRKSSDGRSPRLIPHPFWGAKGFVHKRDGYHIVVFPIATGVFLEQRSEQLRGTDIEKILSQIAEDFSEEQLISGLLTFSDSGPPPIFVRVSCYRRHLGYARNIMRLASCARSRLKECAFLSLQIAEERDGEVKAELVSQHGYHRFPNSGKFLTHREWAEAFASMATSLKKVGLLEKEWEWNQWWAKPFGSLSDDQIWPPEMISLFDQKRREMYATLSEADPSSQDRPKMAIFRSVQSPQVQLLGFTEPFHPKHYTICFVIYDSEHHHYFLSFETERYPNIKYIRQGRPKDSPLDLLTAKSESDDDEYTEKFCGENTTILIIGTSRSFPEPHAEELLDFLAFVCAETKKGPWEAHRHIAVRLNGAKGKVTGKNYKQYIIEMPARELLTEKFWRDTLGRILRDSGDQTQAKGREERFRIWWENKDRLGMVRRHLCPAVVVSEEDDINEDSQFDGTSDSM